MTELPGKVPTPQQVPARGRRSGLQAERSHRRRCNRHRGFDDIGTGTQNETDQICAGWKSHTKESHGYRPKAD